MKKWIKANWFLIAVYLAVSLGINLGLKKVNDDYIQRSVDNAYVKGFEEGVNSVNLGDLCKDPEIDGFGTDFEQGYAYDIVQCKVNFRDWRNDWIIEEEQELKGLEGPTQQI